MLGLDPGDEESVTRQVRPEGAARPSGATWPVKDPHAPATRPGDCEPGASRAALDYSCATGPGATGFRGRGGSCGAGGARCQAECRMPTVPATADPVCRPAGDPVPAGADPVPAAADPVPGIAASLAGLDTATHAEPDTAGPDAAGPDTAAPAPPAGPVVGGPARLGPAGASGWCVCRAGCRGRRRGPGRMLRWGWPPLLRRRLLRLRPAVPAPRVPGPAGFFIGLNPPEVTEESRPRTSRRRSRRGWAHPGRAGPRTSRRWMELTQDETEAGRARLRWPEDEVRLSRCEGSRGASLARGRAGRT